MQEQILSFWTSGGMSREYRICTKTKPFRSSVERDECLGSTVMIRRMRGRPKLSQISFAVPVVEMMIVDVFRSERRCAVEVVIRMSKRDGADRLSAKPFETAASLNINLFDDRRGVDSAFRARSWTTPSSIMVVLRSKRARSITSIVLS